MVGQTFAVIGMATAKVSLGLFLLLSYWANLLSDDRLERIQGGTMKKGMHGMDQKDVRLGG